MSSKSGYNGTYLIKIGDYEFPNNMIKYDTYKAFMSTSDLDSYRDANGKLHRNALSKISFKVEFETKPMITDDEWQVIIQNIRSQYTVSLEKKSLCKMYIPELGSYQTQYCYMPDIEPTIYTANGGTLKYESIRLAFIGYGGEIDD